MSDEIQPSQVMKFLKTFGLACLVIGAALFLYSGAKYVHRFLILDQLTGAENNLRIVTKDDTWEKYYGNKAACRQLVLDCSSSTHLILLTNRKLYIALAGVSVLLAVAGGVMCVAARNRV